MLVANLDMLLSNKQKNEVQAMYSSHVGLLTIAMYQHGETCHPELVQATSCALRHLLALDWAQVPRAEPLSPRLRGNLQLNRRGLIWGGTSPGRAELGRLGFMGGLVPESCL